MQEAEMTPLRKQQIAASVLGAIVPGAEAPDSLKSLERRLARNSKRVNRDDLPDEIVGRLAPALSHLVQSETITVEEGRDFLADVSVGIIETITGRRFRDRVELSYIASCAMPSKGDEMHKHKCSGCDTIWEHSEDCGGLDKAHKCPKCGESQWVRYYPEE